MYDPGYRISRVMASVMGSVATSSTLGASWFCMTLWDQDGRGIPSFAIRVTSPPAFRNGGAHNAGAVRGSRSSAM